ncbi:MAG TPA: hypothetical protein VGG25_28705 [Streptosporangiaceae bacterium]
MSASVLEDRKAATTPPTARPYILGALAALSVGAAAIHFAVIFEHFSENVLYGVFFLVIAWAQLIWAALVLWRPSRTVLWLGILGNAIIIAVYVASRTVGLPVGPDLNHPEAVGGLDVASVVLEVALIAGCAALLWRPALADRPVRRRGTAGTIAGLVAVPAAVIAVTTAVMTPGWAGPEGPAGMASGSSTAAGMPGMGSTGGLPDMRMYGSTAPPTAAQVIAAGQLIKNTDKSLARFQNVQAAFAAGYTYVLKTNGEEHLLYDGRNPAYAGLNPQDPSSLVYAINVPHHAPILLGAMYIERDGVNGPQVGGSMTRWHAHLVVCQGDKPTIAGFGVHLRGTCNPSNWRNRYTAQMLHVWVVPYSGGPFSDDLSQSATNSAVRAVLARQ